MQLRHCVALAAGFLLLGTAASAQAPTPPTAPEPALGDPLPDRVVTFPNGVTALADVVFSTIPGYRPITLDLYRLAGNASAKPLVVYIHGGGWMNGHTRQSGAFSDFPGVLADLAARGYVVASLEYRLSLEAPFPAAIDDVKTAIRFLKANADRYGIDRAKTAVWGGSAGGQLALLSALDCGGAHTGADKANPAVSACPQGAVGWYGIYDFATMPASTTPKAEHAYLDCAPGRCSADRIAAASAVTHVDPRDPPVLLIHGAGDKVVPVSQSQELAARLRAAGVPVDLTVIPDVGHSWLGADAAATRAASLRALDLTFSFFDKLFGKAR